MSKESPLRKRRIPPSSDWDFSGLDGKELYAASIYEYARSIDGLKDAILKGLDEPAAGLFPNVFGLERLPGKTVRDVIRSVLRREGAGQITPMIYNFLLLGKFDRRIRWNSSVAALACRFCEFPKPWMRIREGNPDLHERLRPLPAVPAVELWRDDFQADLEMAQFCSDRPFLARYMRLDVRVDCASLESEIHSDWSALVELQRLQQGKTSSRLPNRTKGKKTELLRDLAAYRLQQTNHTFDYLKEKAKTIKDLRFRPPVSSLTNWRESVTRAAKRIQEDGWTLRFVDGVFHSTKFRILGGENLIKVGK